MGIFQINFILLIFYCYKGYFLQLKIEVLKNDRFQYFKISLKNNILFFD